MKFSCGLLLLLSFILLPLVRAQAPAGGGWVRVARKDPTTGIQSVSYLLMGETIDVERHPAIVLTCDGDKEPTVIYRADVKLAPQAHDVYNHYAGSIWATLKLNEDKPRRALWEIIPGDDLASNRAILDAKTIRFLFGGSKMRVRFRDYQDEDHLDQFAVAGLNIRDLQGFCEPKWLAKNDAGTKAPSH